MFLKWVMFETVRKSAGREFHAAGPEKEKARSANVVGGVVDHHRCRQKRRGSYKRQSELECGPMPNVMVALPNTVGGWRPLFNAAKFS